MPSQPFVFTVVENVLTEEAESPPVQYLRNLTSSYIHTHALYTRKFLSWHLFMLALAVTNFPIPFGTCYIILVQFYDMVHSESWGFNSEADTSDWR